ncbi:unnamed protein product [Lathyrus sativus]|nr:unnamed protein product [Lathyrus sativus]
MLTRLPCCHAISCMKHQHLQVDDFVSDYYKKECYEACYTPVVYPVNGESLWTKTDVVDLQPLPIKGMSDRPKKKMNKEADEQMRNETHSKGKILVSNDVGVIMMVTTRPLASCLQLLWQPQANHYQLLPQANHHPVSTSS